MSLFCSIPLMASLFSACASAAPLAVGYVEGEFVLLAPIDVAKVETVAVRRGDRVEPGEKVAELERDDAVITVSQAEAALAQAKAQLADLQQGKRPDEIAALEATLHAAKATADEARRVLTRVQGLVQKGVSTQAQLDDAETQVKLADGRVGEAEANLAVGHLPARQETITAAKNQVKQASAALDEARWKLSKRSITAPAPGRIDDVIRYPGDLAGPTSPVLSMLPDGAVKLKVYVPEPNFSALKIGTELDVRCDGCPPGLMAKVSYVSPDPEFTPPVIYSLETRQKLVYLVEARPDDGATWLQPGQIVDVTLAQR